jgi:hypothetical protein
VTKQENNKENLIKTIMKRSASTGLAENGDVGDELAVQIIGNGSN